MKKKKILSILLILIISIICLLFKDNKKNNFEQLTVAEVTHSIFYTPWYVAIENGYFLEENIDIDLILTSGADKVSAAVLSGDAQIGFAGPESTIYIYNNKEKDYLVSFAGLTKRDGQFIVSRKNETNFNLKNLINKEILGGRNGGMPLLNFQNALKKNEINQKNININTSVDFASLTGSFISGIGDYVNLFEPNATRLEKEGIGYVVGSIGKLSGEVPYTTFITRKSYINENKDLITRFVKALNKGIKYTFNHDEKQIAKIIKPQFPDSTIEELATIIKRYKDNDSWYNDTIINEQAFINLENIMIDANLIKEYVPYQDLISNIDYE